MHEFDLSLTANFGEGMLPKVLAHHAVVRRQARGGGGSKIVSAGLFATEWLARDALNSLDPRQRDNRVEYLKRGVRYLDEPTGKERIHGTDDNWEHEWPEVLTPLEWRR